MKRVVRSAWEASGWICAERLKPVLPWLAESLEGHGTLELDDVLRAQLRSISIATLKRLMRELSVDIRRKRQSTTKPGSLRRSVPIEIGMSSSNPGWLEIDLVAHCGMSAAGEFVYTLCATDIATGWTERIAILGKSQSAVITAMKRITIQLPFPLRAIHSDNSSEFLNDSMLRWCREENIMFTRGRPYAKNDNAHVEERNWTLVRKLVGYNRFDTIEQQGWLNALYTDMLRLHNNGFQPIMKLVEKHRIEGRLRKTYDIAATPLVRARALNQTPALVQFEALVQRTNPLTLARRIDRAIAAMPANAGGTASA